MIGQFSLNINLRNHSIHPTVIDTAETIQKWKNFTMLKNVRNPGKFALKVWHLVKRALTFFYFFEIQTFRPETCQYVPDQHYSSRTLTWFCNISWCLNSWYARIDTFANTCMLLTTLVGMLHSWDFIENFFLWRVLSPFCKGTGGIGVFASVHWIFKRYW